MATVNTYYLRYDRTWSVSVKLEKLMKWVTRNL